MLCPPINSFFTIYFWISQNSSIHAQTCVTFQHVYLSTDLHVHCTLAKVPSQDHIYHIIIDTNQGSKKVLSSHQSRFSCQASNLSLSLAQWVRTACLKGRLEFKFLTLINVTGLFIWILADLELVLHRTTLVWEKTLTSCAITQHVFLWVRVMLKLLNKN